MDLPTHDLRSQIRKGNRTKAFSEHVSKLIFGGNLDKLDFAWFNLLTKPVVLDGAMFGAGSHASRFKFA